ncbi:histidine kinase [Chitinophaga dinghuensis]|uniref:Histidine kinase n=2 Tax=Chitinophaga dinghuensis TaxID=1539050 RepID=A0A327VKB5_9BACT|nr:histidine kinase [Chitinophaga dinghuensis]
MSKFDLLAILILLASIMKKPLPQRGYGNQLISTYELIVWVLYAVIYKYAVIVESPLLPRRHENFPFPLMMLYALCITLYVIPYYRVIGPWLLDRKKFGWMFFITVIYFYFIPKYANWPVVYCFRQWLTGHPEGPYLDAWYKKFEVLVHTRQIYSEFLLTDVLAFFSVMFMRFAMQNERKRHTLEETNLTLQLETLKAQLHPHFLFNTLNSIYGMTLTGSKEAPVFVLRLSDMMRYMLYDCKHDQVPLEKDITFLMDYLEMEKTRYPSAPIQFNIDKHTIPPVQIAPLLMIPFMENCFKHGSHRILDESIIQGSISFKDNKLFFHLENSVLPKPSGPATPYGGVGIENVRRRLELYYPKKYQLDITHNDLAYIVDLQIQLT